MEIIKRGKKPSETWYKGTCSCCQTIVRFQQHEAKFYPGDSYDRFSSESYSVACPVCISGQIYGSKDTNQEATPKNIDPY